MVFSENVGLVGNEKLCIGCVSVLVCVSETYDVRRGVEINCFQKVVLFTLLFETSRIPCRDDHDAFSSKLMVFGFMSSSVPSSLGRRRAA